MIITDFGYIVKAQKKEVKHKDSEQKCELKVITTEFDFIFFKMLLLSTAETVSFPVRDVIHPRVEAEDVIHLIYEIK